MAVSELHGTRGEEGMLASRSQGLDLGSRVWGLGFRV